MYKSKKVTKSIRTQSEKNFSEGYVRIFDKEISLDPNAYVKREKIYNKKDYGYKTFKT